MTKLKTQIVAKPKNSSCDKAKKNQIVTELKTQIVTKLKNLNCDKTQIRKL